MVPSQQPEMAETFLRASGAPPAPQAVPPDANKVLPLVEQCQHKQVAKQDVPQNCGNNTLCCLDKGAILAVQGWSTVPTGEVGL